MTCVSTIVVLDVITDFMSDVLTAALALPAALVPPIVVVLSVATMLSAAVVLSVAVVLSAGILFMSHLAYTVMFPVSGILLIQAFWHSFS